jgi:O-antigen/teichoic acid export membrane protein
VAELAFGDRHAVRMARALAGFVFATAAYQVTYSIFRGWVMVGWANSLELIVVGALPCALALVGPRRIDALIWALNVSIILVTVAFAAAHLRDALRAGFTSVRERIPTLLRFGLARAPGDIAIAGLFSLGPLVVVHFSSSTQAGYASIVLSTLNLVSVAAVPLGVLLLPRAAADHALGLARESPKYGLLWVATLDVSLGVCGLLIVASPLVMAGWLGHPPPGLVVAQQIAALGIPGYILYLVFRSYLDALHERPYSSVATLAGLAALGACLAGGLVGGLDPVYCASGATAAALSVCGLMIWSFTSRELPVRRLDASTAGLLVWLAFSALAAWVVGSAPLTAVALIAIVACTYVAVLLVTRPPWGAILLARLKGRPSAIG